MKLTRILAIKFFVGIGMKSAEGWDDGKLAERLAQVPKRLTTEAIPDEHRKTYDALVAVKDNGGSVFVGKHKATVGKVETKKVSKKAKAKLKAIAEQKAARRLTVLAGEIRDSYVSADSLAKTAKERGQKAVYEAWRCGKALIEARAIVGHGDWLKWLKKECKGVSDRTCQRYMKLAKTTHVAELKNASSIRQSYIAVGIVEERKALPPAPDSASAKQETTKPEGHDEKKQQETPKASAHDDDAEFEKARNDEDEAEESGDAPLPDPMSVIKRAVASLVALLDDVPKSGRDDARKLLRPLKSWLK